MNRPKDVDAYIAQVPLRVRGTLSKLRGVIKKAAPKAIERISYGMPFYEYGGTGYKGRLVYFAAFKNHISLFIIPRYSDAIPTGLQKYHASKATYQFPLDKPLPFGLIERSIKALVKEIDIQNKQVCGGKPAKTNKNIKSDKNANSKRISDDIRKYNNKQITVDKSICNCLALEITNGLPESESKVWHGHPVWFLDSNPIAGYSKEKRGIRLMFWSGASFDEEGLIVRAGKFKDASIFYNAVSDIKKAALKRWLKKSKTIQWDYKNIVKRKGVLKRIGGL